MHHAENDQDRTVVKLYLATVDEMDPRSDSLETSTIRGLPQCVLDADNPYVCFYEFEPLLYSVNGLTRLMVEAGFIHDPTIDFN